MRDTVEWNAVENKSKFIPKPQKVNHERCFTRKNASSAWNFENITNVCPTKYFSCLFTRKNT